MLGHPSVAPAVAANGAFLARAFPFRSHMSGKVASINVYLDRRSRATGLLVGLYGGANDMPATRLTAGMAKAARAGTWNSVKVPSTSIRSGATYWLVVLGRGGSLYFRHGGHGTCASQPSFQKHLTSLPLTWTGGVRSPMCPLSAYVKGRAAVLHGPLVPSFPNPVGTSDPPAASAGSASGTALTSPGTSTSTTTTPSGPTVTLPPVNDGLPVISGTAQLGQTLTTSTGSWLDSPMSYAYQWQDCDSLGIGCADIAGASASSYTLQASDVGHTIRSVVSATNAGGTSSATSGQTSVVSRPAAPSNTAVPVVSGSAVQGQSLSTTNGSWSGSPTAYAYQWQDCDTAGSNCANISGATGASYTLQAGDVGHTIRSVVSATNAGGTSSATSGQTSVVSRPAAPSNTAVPVVSGSAVQGQSLSTTNGSWSGSPTAYAYQWQDCDTAGSNCANISGATGASYTLQAGDVGHTIRSVVSATNAGGTSSATSAQTSVVSQPAAPSNTAVPVVSGSAVQGQSLSTTNGSWSGSPTAYAYQWQDCDTAGSNCANISGATGASYTLQAGDVGHTIRSVVNATNAGGTSSATSTQTASVTAASGGTQVYVAQNQSGTGSGGDCADAKAVSFFNDAGNWGTGAGQIGPGVTVALCGTISSELTAQGSGTAANPITLAFQSGAKLSQPACSGACLTISNRSYITVDGGSNGMIENTANGSGLANQIASNGIYAHDCNNCTIENLTIENIYQHTSSSDTNGNAQSTGGIDMSGSSNILIRNDTIHDVGTAVYDAPGASDTNIQVADNNIYDINWGFGLARQSSGGTIGPVYMYGNHVHDWGNWDTTSDVFHHNGIYCFTGGSVSTLPHYTGIYVYDNVFDGSDSNNGTTMVWPGGSPGGSETTNPACADSTTPWYIFNNVFNPTGATPGDGELYPTCCINHIYNNTLIAPSSSSGFLLVSEYGGTLDMANNLFDRADTLVDVDTSTIAFSPAPDYDFFANGGGSAFECAGTHGFPSGFTNWQSCSHGDSHGTAYSGTFTLNSDGSLPSGSPALGAAENLTSTCNGQPNPGLGALCENINGTARPSSGAWNAGAY